MKNQIIQTEGKLQLLKRKWYQLYKRGWSKHTDFWNRLWWIKYKWNKDSNERVINVNITEIMSLITVSSDYGFNNNILMQSFADMLKNLSNEEIEMYSSSIGNLDGYTIEDYRSVKEILLDFKNKYKL